MLYYSDKHRFILAVVSFSITVCAATGNTAEHIVTNPYVRWLYICLVLSTILVSIIIAGIAAYKRNK